MKLYDEFHVAGSGISLAQMGQRESQPVDGSEGRHEEPSTVVPC